MIGRNRRKTVRRMPRAISHALHRGGGGGAGPLVRFDARGSFCRTGLVRWMPSRFIANLLASGSDPSYHIALASDQPPKERPATPVPLRIKGLTSSSFDMRVGRAGLLRAEAHPPPGADVPPVRASEAA